LPFVDGGYFRDPIVDNFFFEFFERNLLLVPEIFYHNERIQSLRNCDKLSVLIFISPQSLNLKGVLAIFQ